MKSIGLQLFQIIQDYRTRLIVKSCYRLPQYDPEKYFEDETDYFQRNKDLPDNIQWHDMGIVERKNEHLDPIKDDSNPGGYVNKMNDRHFREMCVQLGGQNFAIKLKTKPDIEPPNHMKIEWVADKLRIEHDLAMQVVDLVRDMEIDRKTMMKMFYAKPYMWTKCSSKEIARDLSILRELHESASEPNWSSLSDNNFAEPIDENWIYMVDEVYETMQVARFNEATNEQYREDHMDVTSPAYPFALFPLYWGKEALSHEFITMIKEADWDKIKEIQKRFFPQYDSMVGKWYAPKYWYLSPSQKSQSWVYINERKEELKNIKPSDLSEECKQCLYWIQQYKRSKYSTALIYAFKDGRSFDSFGIKVDFNRRATGQELNYLWSEYKKIAA